MSENYPEQNIDAEYKPDKPDKPSASSGSVSLDDVQRMIDQALSRQRQQYEDRIEQLQDDLDAARIAAPATVIPEHGAGPGVDTVTEAWSLFDQELAVRGEHPHQRGESADHLAHPDHVRDHRSFGRVRDDDRRLEGSRRTP